MGRTERFPDGTNWPPARWRGMGPLPQPPALDRSASLFLDLDGTLVEFAGRPDAIEVDDALRKLIEQVAIRLDGRLAVISGRSLDDLTDHLGLPELPASGSHGLERRSASGKSGPGEPGSEVAAAIAEAKAFAESEELVFEAKPLGIAVHFRERPEAGPGVIRALQAIANTHGMMMQPGAMVGELRLPGPNKGDVLRLFMAERPFAFGRPVMVGDDLTDEAAFEAVNSLGGTSVLVGPARETNARFGLESVSDVHCWLKELV